MTSLVRGNTRRSRKFASQIIPRQTIILKYIFKTKRKNTCNDRSKTTYRDSRPSDFFDQGNQFERQRDLLGGSVPHELKLPIGGYEVDRPLGIPAAQVDALVKRDVRTVDIFADFQLELRHTWYRSINTESELSITYYIKVTYI